MCQWIRKQYTLTGSSAWSSSKDQSEVVKSVEKHAKHLFKKKKKIRFLYFSVSEREIKRSLAPCSWSAKMLDGWMNRWVNACLYSLWAIEACNTIISSGKASPICLISTIQCVKINSCLHVAITWDKIYCFSFLNCWEYKPSSMPFFKSNFCYQQLLEI